MTLRFDRRDASDTLIAEISPLANWRLWAVPLLLLLVAGAWIHSRAATQTPAATAMKTPVAIPVGVAIAARSDFDVSLAGLGTVTPLTTVSVKTQIAGRITKIGFEEGQLVKEGDFLIEIDPRPYEHALEQAQGQIMRDRALLKNAELDLERYKRLSRGNYISQQQIDTQDSLVHQYRGAVKIDEGQVGGAQLNLEYSRIAAPISGRVGLRQVDVGNFAQPGDATGLVVLTQLQPINVVFPVAEDHVPRIMRQIGEGKRLTVVAYDRSGRRKLAEGRLATVDNQIDTTTGTVKLKAWFENRDFALFPNQFVNIRLTVETLSDVVVVPTASVQYGPTGAFAYVVSDEGNAVPQAIQTGPVEGEHIAVLEGLAPGARVVVSGADRLRDGSKVKAASE